MTIETYMFLIVGLPLFLTEKVMFQNMFNNLRKV